MYQSHIAPKFLPSWLKKSTQMVRYHGRDGFPSALGWGGTIASPALNALLTHGHIHPWPKNLNLAADFMFASP